MHLLRSTVSVGAVGEVVVFQPQWCGDEDGPRRLPQRTIPVVGALLAAGFDVRFLEQAHDGMPAADWRPVVEAAVACVVWCGEMYPAMQIPGLLRFLELCAGQPRLPVLVGGGFFPLLAPAELGIERMASAVVVGPGEIVLPDAVAALARGASLRDVAGLAVFTDAGCVMTAPARRRALPASLNAPLHQLDLRRYTVPEPRVFGNDAPCLQVHTGSGCAKRCPFCFDEHTPYGVFAAAAVVDALATAHTRAGVDQILLGELDFFHRTSRVLAIAEGLLRRNLRLSWFALGSVCDLDRLTEGDLELIARSGCRRIEIGLESGSDVMLRRLGKGHTVTMALRTIGRLRAHGIATTANVLFGTPGETDADAWATVDLCLRAKDIDPAAHFNVRMYQIIPTTTAGDAAAAHTSWMPRSLADLLHYRQELVGGGTRALPWLTPGQEAWVRHLVEYLLPMALGETIARATPLSRTLGAVARARCRLHLRHGIGVDRRIAARLGRRHLLDTLVP